MDRWLTDENLEAVQRLEPIADSIGLTLHQLALAWILRRNEVASAIIGASRPEQVHQNAVAVDAELTAGVIETADEVLAGVAVTGPELGPLASEGVKHR